MNQFRLLVCLGLLGGCGSSAYVATPTPVSQHGTYRFTDRIGEASPPIAVEGEFTIQADTILAGVASGFCHPAIPVRTQTFNFACGTVTLSFDRHNPLQGAFYSVQGTAMELQRVCTQYGTGPTGRPFCLAYKQERVQVVRSFSGRIRPIPVP